MPETTITDVARAAGVAASTVSRALNGGTVKAETRERILRIASQLGYRTGQAAAGQGGAGAANGAAGNIGVFVTDIVNFYFTDVFKGLFSVAQNAGYRVFVTDIGLSGDRDETIRNVIGACAGQVFVSPRMDDAEIARLCGPENTVFTNRPVEGYSSVCIDDHSGVLQAVRHLASLGHRRIAYVSGSDDSYANIQRREACLEAAASYGMECEVVGPFEPSYAGGVNAGDALLLEEGITGVVAFNDLMASGLIGRLTGRGVAVPERMSVVGIDDSVLSRVMMPQMTTVDVRQERMGAQAMRMLIDKIEAVRAGDMDRARRAEVAMVPEILVTRDSTTVPAAAEA